VAQCGENLLIGGLGVAQEKPQRGHDHPRRAEATLERAVADEGLLQGMQLSLPRQSLNGEDLGALGFQGREAARADGLAVQQNGARAAGPFPAADFGAGEAQVVAEDVGEGTAFGHIQAHRLAVDGHLQRGHRASRIDDGRQTTDDGNDGQ
jgi:hypothetical protein